MYLLVVIALLVFGYGMFRLYREWRQGKPQNRLSDIPARLWNVVKQSLAQKRILRERKPGLMHSLIAWGFLALFLTTCAIALQVYTGLPLFKGTPYLVFKVLANTAGLCMLAGLIIAAVRRLGRPDYLSRTKDDYWVLIVLAAIIVTGFLVQAIRIAIAEDPWSAFGYVGWLMAPALSALFSVPTLSVLHVVFWWLHLLLALFFIAWLPYSKLAHIVLGPLGQFLYNRDSQGVPGLIDFEDETLESYGKSRQAEFPWKSFLDLDACVRCGRCQIQCPANVSGKHLNPRGIIQDIKEHVHAGGEEVLPGAVIREEDIWACMTCRSCEEQCPLFIEHADRLVELRRWLVLTESRFPSELKQVFRNLETNGNAWGIGFATREDVYREIGLENAADAENAEILLWPGCAGAFDPRNQKVLGAFAQLLSKADIAYVTLGNAERCCGDPARRLGNEYLFQTLATENIETIKATGIKRIVTTCPHCLHMLKEEYPSLGGDFEVVHHTQFLSELMRDGRLATAPHSGELFFHDSCYLGRYAGEFEAPRELLRASGYELKEAPRNREKSFCCGGGGGRMWQEEPEGQRVSEIRIAEFAPADVPVVTACPYCLTMLQDAVASSGQQREIRDIAEALLEAV
jgi:Fe-S oxidoreductase/nitrate reductase gamma subunit